MLAPSEQQPMRIAVIGAGFAGLWTARGLAGKKGVAVTLIDRNNYHTFLPLLYQVAAAELEPDAIAYPVRGIFRKVPNVTTIMAEVTGIDAAERLLTTRDGPSIPYDQLVIASGSRTSYFNTPGAEKNAFSLKTLEEGVALRNHMLGCFERAALEVDSGNPIPEGLLTVAIVGSGATGVEYAGALAELIAAPLARDFPSIPENSVKIILLDAAAEAPLPPFPPRLREYTRERLARMGIEVQTNAAATEVQPDAIILGDGVRIQACTIVWTAGVRGADLGETCRLPLGKGGRIEVGPTLQVVNRPEIYVAGDMAIVNGMNIPMVAPAAIQMGQLVAKNILRSVNGDAGEAFVYKDKGSLATIGRKAAVVKIGSRSVTGFPAWALWLVVHLAYLIGFRNRIMVLINWAWDYLFFERAVRLILPKTESVMNVCGTGKNECADNPAPK